MCANNGCGRTPIAQTRGSAIAVSDGGRTASNVERRAFEAERQPRQPITDPESEQRKSQRAEAQRREGDKLREPYKRYFWHQLERGGQPMPLQQFIEIGAYARERIAGIIERDEKRGE